MRFDVITLFPEMFETLRLGVVGRAIKSGIAELVLWNPRDDAVDVHRTVDARPYGGGPGMVMMVQPLRAALKRARRQAGNGKVIYLSPQGQRFDQRAARMLATEPALILVSGRYEGVDERFIVAEVDEEWSIGDYVVSGGELPAMVMIDAITRLLPGVLGHDQSAVQDSHADGLLDCPHFTRPESVDGESVPEILLSGDHAAIAKWRLQQALGQTWLRRPDLLERRGLSDDEQDLLDDFIRTFEGAREQEQR